MFSDPVILICLFRRTFTEISDTYLQKRHCNKYVTGNRNIPEFGNLSNYRKRDMQLMDWKTVIMIKGISRRVNAVCEL